MTLPLPRAGPLSASFGAGAGTRMSETPGKPVYSRGGLGLNGAWNAFAPLTLSFRA